ncbi:flagellar filament capping protein FliD [Bacillus timonensis]|nr:flagellar filament capping protein FliD [Bacillus timonensis]
MRIGGLASGMDIDTLVKDLMKAERMPLDKLKQKKQILEWQRDDYRSMNSLLLSFRNEVFNMKLTSSYRARSTTSTDDTRVTATATSAASASSYSISEVSQLASAATKVNTGTLSGATKIDASKGLYETRNDFSAGEAAFQWKQGNVASKTISATSTTKNFSLDLKAGTQLINATSDTVVKVNGEAYKVVSAPTTNAKEVYVKNDGTLEFGADIQSGSSIKVDYYTDFKIDEPTISTATKEIQLTKGSVVGGSLSLDVGGTIYTNTGADPTQLIDGSSTVVGTIDLNTGKITMNNDIAANTAVKATYKQNYFTFDVTSHTSKGAVTEKFGVQGTESLNTVIGRINNSNAGVTAFYDSFSDKMTLTRKETGNYRGLDSSDAGFSAAADDEIVTSAGFLNDVLKFGGAVEKGGENAVFTVNGLTTERSTNSFEMSGVTFTLKKTFAATDPAVSVSVGNDTNKVFDKIKAFVEKYNETIGKIQEKISEDRYRTYQPLTDDERESLSDKEVEMWEEKAKSGLLRRDSMLSSGLSSMRLDFNNQVSDATIDPKYNQLATIGIKTSSNYLEGGKLIIDEAKLKAAIQDNPEAVEKLFTNSGTTDSQKGLAVRLYDTVNEIMDKVKQRAGNSFSTTQQYLIGRNLTSIDKRIDSFEDKLVRVEDRYWRQFTAMEKAIQKSNEQAMYLMQQFSM